MKEIKEIVEQSIAEVRDENFCYDKIRETVKTYSDDQGNIELTKSIAVSLDLSTSFSSSVLYKVLTTMKSEGYFKD
ncbi:hypothetical protein ACFPVV_01565 [Macrococcoides bohemicum]|uniref:Uncharacterized protein n=1 Tax=Macrococcoides bohemicum TaxID=1903056 RepID=A0A328A8Y5_9STAP|nr:hypothetical protein [Macrococcus bohemicus]RAK50174.1 hypothetical protein BHX94_01540 [Macrococcus bohemicus]